MTISKHEMIFGSEHLNDEWYQETPCSREHNQENSFTFGLDARLTMRDGHNLMSDAETFPLLESSRR
jgi:transcriptional antiterminator Rof (Rho-off)